MIRYAFEWIRREDVASRQILSPIQTPRGTWNAIFMPFLTRKEIRQRMHVSAWYFPWRQRLIQKSSPRWFSSSSFPPDAVNPLIFLFSLVLGIRVERLITFLFYFNFNQSSNRLIHHPPNFIPSKVSCLSQPSSASYQEWAWHFI